MLEAELEDGLGYSKYDYKNKTKSNSRNSYSKKTIRYDYGKVDTKVLIDRNGEFDPKIVKKNKRDVSFIEDQVLSMYTKRMTTRDIERYLEDLYGMDASPELISRITDKILPPVDEWQARPLEEVYEIVFVDTIHYKVRSEGRVINKAAYSIIGINLEGIKDVSLVYK